MPLTKHRSPIKLDISGFNRRDTTIPLSISPPRKRLLSRTLSVAQTARCKIQTGHILTCLDFMLRLR